MRKFEDIVYNLLEIIPNEQEYLRYHLNELVCDVDYFRAPESPDLRWVGFKEIIKGCIITPTEDWHFEVLSVISNRPQQEIKEYYS